MRQKSPSIILLFHTTAAAMATEKVCKHRGLPGRLIPAPRDVTADCGIAWCAPAQTKDALLTALTEEGIEAAAVREQLY